MEISEIFKLHPIKSAQELLNYELVLGDSAGRIVETEAYLDKNDEASHIFTRPSTRRFVKEHPEGTAYVYLNYGMYWLCNVLIKSKESNGFVLFRALEPTQGIESMIKRRNLKNYKDDKILKNLCNGPGKLSLSLNIDKRFHGNMFLNKPNCLHLRKYNSTKKLIISKSNRIGISKAKDYKWRFCIKDSIYLSKKK